MPASAAIAAPPGSVPAVCYLKNWICFGPGLWKGTLYSLADCLAMGRNFQRLSTGANPLVVPQVKLAHDTDQDLAKWLEASKGFPSLGRVYGLRVSANGLCALDLEIPTQIGALRNAGRYVDGSIEIAPPLPDPERATTKLYPVLVAIGLLGEEQPAVPLRYPMPRAVFADGREVPAEHDLTPLAQAMAEVAKAFSSKARSGATQGRFSYRGQQYSTAVVCFSAMTPLPKGRTMDPAKKAALEAAGFTPEEIAKMEAALGGAAMATVPPNPAPTPAPAPDAGKTMTDPKPSDDPIAAMSAKFAADSAAPQYAKDMMSAFAAFAADCNKRFSATEAAVQETKGEAKMAASFSTDYQKRVAADHRADVERVVDQAITEGRLEARDRADKITVGLTKDRTVVFAAGTAGAGKTAFAVWKDELLTRKPSRFFGQDPALTDPPPGGKPEDDAFVKRALATLPGERKPAYSPVAK